MTGLTGGGGLIYELAVYRIAMIILLNLKRKLMNDIKIHPRSRKALQVQNLRQGFLSGAHALGPSRHPRTKKSKSSQKESNAQPIT